MAEAVSELVGRMKESQPSSYEPDAESCGSPSQGDLDEALDRDSDVYEERFRVDRRKLEYMLQTAADGMGEGAEQFFQRVMEETNTEITWPSKLKIGAKSKKDPHIKVAGEPDDVRNAKDRIMCVLDTKSNRVTLKMDVSHTDHSHVIGKGGNNIKRVMQQTGCHIHFPDSNRGSTTEKSNQVSIAGQPTGVESARAHIRELLPLAFSFELPITGVLQPVPDTSSPPIQNIMQQHNVTVTFKQRPRMYVTTVIVRGTVSNAKAVTMATKAVMEHLAGNSGTNIPISTQLEIAPQHHLFMIGRGGMNVKHIMQRTGASIHFPDPNNVTPQRKGTVYITGGIESVFLARQQLIQCLPLVLMFDMKADVEVGQAKIAYLMEQLDVFISIKPKPKQPSKSVIVKSIERNALNMYEARRVLLGLDRDDQSLPPSIHEATHDISPTTNSLGLAGLGMLGQNTLSINTLPNPVYVINGQNCQRHQSTSSETSGSPGSTSPNNWLTSHSMQGPPMLLQVNNVGNFPPITATYNLLTQCNGLKDLNQNSAFIRVPTPEKAISTASSNPSSATSPSDSPRDSPIDLINKNPGSPQGSESHEVVTVKSGNGYMNVVVPKQASPSNSGSGSDLLGLNQPPGSTVNTLSPAQQQILLLEGNMRSMAFQNGDRSSESGTESDGSDPLAPGSNRPSPGNSMNSNTNSLFSNNAYPFDYERKKLLATKAMQKKPEGESRIPTDYWAGLGFSKSMPDSAIRDKMNFSNNTYKGPTMPTTYESTLGEEDDGIDRDPWRDSTKNKPLCPAPGDFPSPRKKQQFKLDLGNHVDSSAHLRNSSSSWPPKTDLAELFSRLGLGKYTDLFQQQEIDFATFLTLTDQDLKELGITTFGARRKMLLAIADLNKRKSFSATPGSNNPFRDTGSFIRRHDLATQSGRW
ncbi:protein bicaudal C homolog 1-B isoform X2 [Lingula anatina]|uniref:Protein bicaudal C homolog 1-B isoform X2 n=1 Tax=Lingula anatina TaxID=7574 RepID=A0A2R2MMB1_LINAN|nr:protein bicaudal C homolog 1-B isoform X2 [Lingula anatina]|eukprot:XP_023931361.1 protein bicaudal C homolog 1-B isoform X2 [Lingula anatina]